MFDIFRRGFTSLDSPVNDKLLLVGDSKGTGTLLTQDGGKVWEIKLHKSKIKHIQFNPR